MKKKKVTIAEIARASGTSAATVSRSLNHPDLVNENTLLLIHNAMKSLNYITEATYTREKDHKKLILVNISDPSNMFYTDIVQGISSSILFHNYHALFVHESLNSSDSIEYLLRQAEDFGVSGIILCNPVHPEYCTKISEHIPIVQCAEYSSDDFSHVGIDDCKATKTALDHIYSLGRRKTLFVNGPLNYRYAKKRQEAFVSFMEQVGIPPAQYQIINLPKIDFDMAFASVNQTLSSSNLPDSIFATSDVFAVASLKAAKNHGIQVPRDMVIVGFDNINLLSGVATPSITSVNQPTFQMGYTASEILLEAIQSKGLCGPPKHVILGTELIIRESSSINAS